MKTCVYCKIEKDIVEFPRHSLYKDNLDMRCRDCIKKHVKIRKELHKNAPSKPEFCECCGKIPRKWCLDHDHKTDKFRGWLCDKCNTGIGKLGDDLEGVMKAVEFLKKCSHSSIGKSNVLLKRRLQVRSLLGTP